MRAKKNEVRCRDGTGPQVHGLKAAASNKKPLSQTLSGFYLLRHSQPQDATSLNPASACHGAAIALKTSALRRIDDESRCRGGSTKRHGEAAFLTTMGALHLNLVLAEMPLKLLRRGHVLARVALHPTRRQRGGGNRRIMLLTDRRCRRIIEVIAPQESLYLRHQSLRIEWFGNVGIGADLETS